MSIQFLFNSYFRFTYYFVVFACICIRALASRHLYQSDFKDDTTVIRLTSTFIISIGHEIYPIDMLTNCCNIKLDCLDRLSIFYWLVLWLERKLLWIVIELLEINNILVSMAALSYCIWQTNGNMLTINYLGLKDEIPWNINERNRQKTWTNNWNSTQRYRVSVAQKMGNNGFEDKNDFCGKQYIMALHM